MHDISALVEPQARHSQIQERVVRARRPHVPAVPRRHLFADRLRRIADRIDN
jgi:hypothetical protein